MDVSDWETSLFLQENVSRELNMAQRKPKSAGSGKDKKSSPATKAEDKRVYFKQSDFPQATLQQAQRVASALVDNFASDSGSPPDGARSGNQSHEQRMANTSRRIRRVWPQRRRGERQHYEAHCLRPAVSGS